MIGLSVFMLAVSLLGMRWGYFKRQQCPYINSKDWMDWNKVIMMGSLGVVIWMFNLFTAVSR